MIGLSKPALEGEATQLVPRIDEEAIERPAQADGLNGGREKPVIARTRGRQRAGEELVQTLNKLWSRYRRQLRRSQRRLSVESLHDLRVQTRRFLVGLHLIAPIVGPSPEGSAARKTLEKRLSALGPLRDVHVQLIDLDAQLPDFPEMTPLHRLLRRRANRLSQSAAKALKRMGITKLSQRLKAIRRGLGKGLKQALAIEDLRKAYRQSRHEGLAALAGVRANRFRDEAKVHDVRIALKHLRYGAETLPASLRAVSTSQIEKLKAVVGMLGRMHDIDVHIERLAKWERRGRLAASATTAYRGELARRRRRLESELMRLTPRAAAAARPDESLVDNSSAND